MAKNGSKRPGKVTASRVVQFRFDQETPGAWRLKEVAPEGAKADDMLIGSLYMRKAQQEKKPEEVEVMVTVKK